MPEKALKATPLNMPFCNLKGIILCIKTFIDCKMASAHHVAFLKILKAPMPLICIANCIIWVKCYLNYSIVFSLFEKEAHPSFAKGGVLTNITTS